MGERRDAKKTETRQRISDVATALFLERGFEAVTVEQVAAAAHVSRMTVFNYFPRKEDLMLDRQDDLRMALFCDAVESRPHHQSAADALRALVAELSRRGQPFTRTDAEAIGWWRFVATSPSLQARLRELYDEAADGLARALGGPDPDARARLAAGVIVHAVRTARDETIRAHDSGASEYDVAAAFHAVLEHGFDAVERLS
jgi:AcrR family transcriptional regulator